VGEHKKLLDWPGGADQRDAITKEFAACVKALARFPLSSIVTAVVNEFKKDGLMQ
jgi:hypothetical protein